MEEKTQLYFTFRSGQAVQPVPALALCHVGEIAKSRGTERAARRGAFAASSGETRACRASSALRSASAPCSRPARLSIAVDTALL